MPRSALSFPRLCARCSLFQGSATPFQLLWSTSPNANDMLGNSVRSPVLKVGISACGSFARAFLKLAPTNSALFWHVCDVALVLGRLARFLGSSSQTRHIPRLPRAVQSSKSDFNIDGKADELRISLSMPLANDEVILGITALAFVNVEFFVRRGRAAARALEGGRQ